LEVFKLFNTEISINPLKKAVVSLEKALFQNKDEFLRDAVIQRFEYTFELSWKLLKRYLGLYSNVTSLNIKDIFREAGKQGLIGNVEHWFEFLEARNLTSHTYNEFTAENTYDTALQFLPEVKVLTEKLEQKLNAN